MHHTLVDLAPDLAMDLSWLVTLCVTTEVGFTIGSDSGADVLWELLSPYADQFVDNATNWFGSVTRYLGMLAHLRGDWDEADRQFAAAVERHTSLPAPAMLARSEIDWATSLMNRPNPDRSKAGRLVASCRSRAEPLALRTVLNRCEQLDH